MFPVSVTVIRYWIVVPRRTSDSERLARSSSDARRVRRAEQLGAVGRQDEAGIDRGVSRFRVRGEILLTRRVKRVELVRGQRLGRAEEQTRDRCPRRRARMPAWHRA